MYSIYFIIDSTFNLGDLFIIQQRIIKVITSLSFGEGLGGEAL